MSTLNTPQRLDNGLWLFSWTGTAPFRVFNYERMEYEFTSTDQTEAIIEGSSDIEPPALEVFDSTETQTPDGVLYPNLVTLQWRGYKYAESYTIQLDSGAGYVDVWTVLESGRGYYTYTTTALEDGDTASYRVVMEDLSGATSNTDFDIVIATLPVTPLLTYTYSAGTGNLTIDAV